MKHSFSFPEPVRNAVKNYVNSKISQTDPKRYYQEPNYTAALLSKLEEVVFSDSDCHLEIISTVLMTWEETLLNFDLEQILQ